MCWFLSLLRRNDPKHRKKSGNTAWPFISSARCTLWTVQTLVIPDAFSGHSDDELSVTLLNFRCRINVNQLTLTSSYARQLELAPKFPQVQSIWHLNFRSTGWAFTDIYIDSQRILDMPHHFKQRYPRSHPNNQNHTSWRGGEVIKRKALAEVILPHFPVAHGEQMPTYAHSLVYQSRCDKCCYKCGPGKTVSFLTFHKRNITQYAKGNTRM